MRTSCFTSFVKDSDGRGDGLQMVDIQASDMDAIETAAQRLSLPLENGCVTVCGTVIRFTD